MKELQTKRLLLRGFQESDLEDLYLYAKDPDIGPMAGWKPHETKEESREILELFMKNKEVWAIVDQSKNKVIGSIGLHDKKQDCLELGYVLSKEFWGQGLMQEAARAVIDWCFTYTPTTCIKAYHFDFNTQSKRVLEKLQFSYVKCVKNHFKRFDDVLLDDYEYILKKERV